MIRRRVVAIVLLAAFVVGAEQTALSRSCVDDLWGSSITVRELLKETASELFSVFPPESWDAPVHWGYARVRAIRSERSESPLAEAGEVIEVLFGSGCSQLDVHLFEFFSFNEVVTPLHFRVPYMAVASCLEEDGKNIASDSDSESNTYLVLAADTKDGCDGGWYRTVGYHWVTFPPGYSPPSLFNITVTPRLRRWT